MKRVIIGCVVTLMLMGCSAQSAPRPEPTVSEHNPQVLDISEIPSPTPEPTKTAVYEYKYQVLDISEDCNLSSDVAMALAMENRGMGRMSEEERAALNVFLLCQATVIQKNLDEHGAAGWRLVAFDPQPGVEGIEFAHRLIWERQH